MRELFAQPLAPRLSHFEPLLAASPGLRHSMQRVTTIAQAILLEDLALQADHASHAEHRRRSSSSSGQAQGSGAAGADAPRHLLVLNTHLFFHAAAPHIRNMHIAAMVTEGAALAREFLDQPAAAQRGAGALAHEPEAATPSAAGSGGVPEGCAVVFCGDLNSDLNDGVPGVVRMLSEGMLPADYWDWELGADFDFRETRNRAARSAQIANADAAAASDTAAPQQPAAEPGRAADPFQPTSTVASGGAQADAADTDSDGSSVAEDRGAAAPPTTSNSKGIAVTGVDVALPCAFVSSHTPASQAMTNVVPGFEGVLDYIWCQRGRVRVALAHPVPGKRELGGFLPNARNPSDHLPVVADLLLARDLDTAQHAASARGAGAPAVAGAGAPVHSAPPAWQGNVLAASDDNAPGAAQQLLDGRVVVLPTDTLYGLAALCSHEAAIDRVYEVKGRQRKVPLAVCVPAVGDLPAFVQCGHLPAGLLSALLPGPVTVVLRRRGCAPLAQNLNVGMDTLAIRVPGSGFVGGVCQHAGMALALTSANRSGEPSTVAVDEFEELWPEVAAVYDGGRIAGDARGSTIVDLSEKGVYKVLREGSALEGTARTLHWHGLQLVQ